MWIIGISYVPQEKGFVRFTISCEIKTSTWTDSSESVQPKSKDIYYLDLSPPKYTHRLSPQP